MKTRRTIVALGAAALTSSCAAARGFSDGLAVDLGGRARERLRLPRVNVSAERMIRADVGLRPFRPTGFRVAREALGEKTLVHNYGHGGGGITLSWGTAKLAVDSGFDSAKPECAVLGCGAVGMATARLLQERGARVTIYAKDLPPNTTSNIAGAQWWPSSVYDHTLVTEDFRAQHTAAAHFAFRRFQTLVGDTYGVSWERNYSLSNTPNDGYPTSDSSPLADLVINRRDLRRDEHPFAAGYVRQFDTMMVETPLYLRRMEADVRLAGGEIVVREMHSVAEVAALPQRTIFNCTGLGAGALFNDTEIIPMRGQLAILEPQPEIDYNVLDGGLYMFGRRDGIVLGGTFERGEWSTTPVPSTIAHLISAHKAIFDAMAR